LFFFLSTEYSQLNELETQDLDDHDFTPSADIFYSRSTDRFRILGEILLTDEEQELERFQVGWQLSEPTRIWLGRFHQSSSYWNTEFHHGQFLQTAITRPAIEEFEDVGGVLLMHTTGLLVEHQQELGGQAGLQISFYAGLSGTLESEVIEPFDLLDPEGGHGDSVSVRVGFLPEFLGDDQIGLTYGRHELNVAADFVPPSTWPSGTDRLDLTTIGLYGDWSWGKWRLLAAGNDVDAAPGGGSSGVPSSFVGSYAQIEYRVKGPWTTYARVEHTSGDEEYLDLFPQYVRNRSLVGGRWLFHAKHALNIEVETAEIRAGHFHRVMLQWSAVLP